jgi:ATP-dependent Lon protease
MGLPILVSLVSLFRGQSVRPDVALTGEITLRGKVLRVDGLKQKCLAAHHAGVAHIVIPRQNEADLADVPSKIRQQINVHLVSNVDEALVIALGEPPRTAVASPAVPPPA